MCVVYICLLIVLSSLVACEKTVICYYGTWATYRNGAGKFDVENINTQLCSHLVYAFAGIDQQGKVISLDPYLDLPDNWGRNNFGKFNALKQNNSKLKTILAVGGWNEGSAKYSIMAANPTFRKNFISSTTKMLLNYGFDGLSLDWEYPNRRDTVYGKTDIENYTTLLKEIKTEFVKYGLILSAAVSATPGTASLSYNIPEISQYLDLIEIMTYDMYGPWDSVTGHNSPLHKGEGFENISKDKLNTLDVSLDYWLSQGSPRSKLAIGLPLYGHTFILANSKVNSVGAPSNGAGIEGPYTNTRGSLGYNEFCNLLKTENWDNRYDSLAKVPYAVQGSNWVSFDDAESLTEKIKYTLQYNVTSVIIWSIETDDFHGTCHSEDFPLLRAINRALNRSINSTISTTTSTRSPSTTTSTRSPSTTTSTRSPSTSTSTVRPSSTSSESSPPDPPPAFECNKAGFFPDPQSCSRYIVCVKIRESEFQLNSMSCPSGLHWDHDLMTCNYPENVDCKMNLI